MSDQSSNQNPETAAQFYWSGEDNETLTCICGEQNPELYWVDYFLGVSANRCLKCFAIARYVSNFEGGYWEVVTLPPVTMQRVGKGYRCMARIEGATLSELYESSTKSAAITAFQTSMVRAIIVGVRS